MLRMWTCTGNLGWGTTVKSSGSTDPEKLHRFQTPQGVLEQSKSSSTNTQSLMPLYVWIIILISLPTTKVCVMNEDCWMNFTIWNYFLKGNFCIELVSLIVLVCKRCTWGVQILRKRLELEPMAPLWHFKNKLPSRQQICIVTYRWNGQQYIRSLSDVLGFTSCYCLMT